MEELYELLESFKDCMGDFACSGFLPELGYPGLVIENVGDISLPLPEEQAQKIIEVAKKALFGLGAQTLVDETVRKTWQLDPNQVTIKNKHFIAGVEEVVSTIKKNLGCNKKDVKANLYKVLLYEKGGHFKAHRDTEKESGMFATMVIQLPSQFEGGKITVRHAGDEKCFEMDEEGSAYCCKYAAHYSDCEHEVSEITGGYRLALVYSLCWTASGEPPSADTHLAIVKKVAKVLPEVCTGDRKLFSYFLSHKYSKSGLSGSGIDALKGADEAVARALEEANKLLPEDQQFDFYIAKVKRELHLPGDYWEGRFEAEGHEEEDVNINNYIEFDGTPTDLDVAGHLHLNIRNDVVNFQGPIEDMSVEDVIKQFWGEADGEENTGPTGNEGAIQTYWYKTYAILAWQKDNEVNLRCKLRGYDSAVGWLSEEVEKLENEDPSSSAYRNVVSSLKTVIEYAISDTNVYTWVVRSLLKSLTKLGSEVVDMANQFITNATVMAVITSEDNGIIGKPLVDLVLALGWPSLSESVKKLLEQSPVARHGNWAKFLKSLVQNNVKKDACFLVVVACLVEKVQADAQNNQLESGKRSRDDELRLQEISSLVFLLDDVDLLAKFTDAIQTYCQQAPTSSLPQNLIKYLEKQNINHNQFWKQLLNLRIVQLEAVEKVGVPPFTWNQDNAVFNGHPQVQAFLRGSETTMTYYRFTGIGQARNFAGDYFGNRMSSWGCSVQNTSYSATATPAGVGRNAHVLIEKTRGWYDKKIAPVLQQLEELKKLRGMINPVYVVPTNQSETETLEPQAKKRAIGVLCID